MKRCPECRRDYYDDSLFYCLDDGSPLGGSAAVDEPITEVFQNTEPPSDRGADTPDFLHGREEDKFHSADNRFWVAVLPFDHFGTDSVLEFLANGLTQDIVTGLSRFSYLRVIEGDSSERQSASGKISRSARAGVTAEYLIRGSVRQVGAALRITVQLVEANSGGYLWAENYDRPFHPDDIFKIQDEVVPRIVSTIADMHGVLPHAMSETLRGRDPKGLSPYEAVLRAFGYIERITAAEHSDVRAILEAAVEGAPEHADCWAMLSFMYAEEHKHGFNERPDPLGRALDAARRAVAMAPSDNLAHHVLAQALFFRREFDAFQNIAERAVALNPMDGGTIAFMGILLSYAGEWERGCSLAETAMALNPHHPGWYRFSAFNNAFRKGNHIEALDVALKFNMPSYFYTHVALAAVYGHLEREEGAKEAIRELLELKPDFATVGRTEMKKWFVEADLLETYIEGLRLAGLHVE